MNSLNVGDKVQWSCMIGRLTGVVKRIYLARNAAGDLIPWVGITYWDPNFEKEVFTSFAATEDNLAMMHVDKVRA